MTPLPGVTRCTRQRKSWSSSRDVGTLNERTSHPCGLTRRGPGESYQPCHWYPSPATRQVGYDGAPLLITPVTPPVPCRVVPVLPSLMRDQYAHQRSRDHSPATWRCCLLPLSMQLASSFSFLN